MSRHLRLLSLCCAGLVGLLAACVPAATPSAIPPSPTPTTASLSTETAVSPTQFPAVTASPTPVGTPAGGDTGQLVFSSNRNGAYADLYVMNLDGSGLTLLAQGDLNFFAGPWSPDGHKLLYTGFGLVHSYVGVMNADGSNQTDLSQQPNTDEAFPAWSTDGQHIAFTSRRDGNNEIYVMGADGSQPTRLTTAPGDDFAPAWSPDGARLAFVSDRDRDTGFYSLYIMDADGSHITRLTQDQGIDYAPAWSPDGTRLVFRSDQNGAADIYMVKADGSDLHALTSNQGNNWSPTWSPDGQQIIFQTNRDGNWEIYLMNADGTQPRNLTQNPADDQYPFLKPSPTTIQDRITFAPEATYGFVQGQLAAGASQTFMLAAQKNQPLFVELDSANQDVYLAIAGATGQSPILTADAKQTTWQGLLPATQDYTLTATAGGEDSNFVLNVELPRRLTFAPGAVSVVVTGTAQTGPVVSYVLSAQADQTMTATITSPQNNVFLTIYGFSDGIPLVRSAMDAASATIKLPGTQDYIVKAVQSGDPWADFTLTITIK